MEKIDVLIFGGQSNMQGQTEALPEENAPVSGAWEYRVKDDAYIPLAHPVGEGLENGLLSASDQGHGSLVPDFCRAYTEKTGIKVAAIHAARGNTRIDEWEKGTARYACALDKIRNGIRKAEALGEVGEIYYIWLQGESDAVCSTPADEYIRRLIRYKDDLKADVGISRFGVIQVGYFCRNVSWLTDCTKEEAALRDETIRSAQLRAVEADGDFCLLTQICGRLSMDPQYLNPYAEGHYNNRAMTLIGTDAGNALAAVRLQAGGKER